MDGRRGLRMVLLTSLEDGEAATAQRSESESSFANDLLRPQSIHNNINNLNLMSKAARLVDAVRFYYSYKLCITFHQPYAHHMHSKIVT